MFGQLTITILGWHVIVDWISFGFFAASAVAFFWLGRKSKEIEPHPEPQQISPPAVKLDLLSEIIIYIISKSTQTHFSKTKLKNYIVLINQNYLLDITVKKNTRGYLNIPDLNAKLGFLKTNGLLKELPVPAGSWGNRINFEILKKPADEKITEGLKSFIGELIKTWDKSRADEMKKDFN